MATRDFSDAEWTCKNGCGGLPPQDFQDEVQLLREAWGKPLVISSGFRCSKYNQAVSSTGPHGPHTRAAVDFQVEPEHVWDFVRLAISLGWTGIGINQRGPIGGRFVHLDRLPNAQDCPRPRFWSY